MRGLPLIISPDEWCVCANASADPPPPLAPPPIIKRSPLAVLPNRGLPLLLCAMMAEPKLALPKSGADAW